MTMVEVFLKCVGLVLFAVLAFGVPILQEMYGDERGWVLPRDERKNDGSK